MTTITITQTANNANAFESTGNSIVDFFMMFVRDLDNTTLDNYMNKCWHIDPKKTLAIIFNSRDRTEGKKEKNISNRAMIWLKRNKNKTYMLNLLNYINKYGCWKDVSYIAIKNVNHNDFEVDMMAQQLRKDKESLATNDSVSLCAKWAPTERDRTDKKIQSAQRLALKLFPDDNTKLMEKYRKEYIAPLRKRIDIVESYMTSDRWKQISYDKVPAVATRRLKNAFVKHDPDGYQKYLAKVRSGEKKINVTGILPHELVKFYIDNPLRTECDETIELQWQALIDNMLSTGRFKNMIAVADVSGSMYDDNSVRPIDVSIALSILIAKCNSSSHFKNKIISFSDNPVIFELKGTTLCENVHNILTNLPMGYSTNVESVFDLLINSGTMFDIPPEDMPSDIVLLSDMQFNEASGESHIREESLHETIIKKYEKTNYKPPKIIYMNLSASYDNTFPVKCISDNVAMISGFSEQLLKVFMNKDDLNPENIVDEILSKYIDSVEIHPDDDNPVFHQCVY
jgi:hypothetical protein